MVDVDHPDSSIEGAVAYTCESDVGSLVHSDCGTDEADLTECVASWSVVPESKYWSDALHCAASNEVAEAVKCPGLEHGYIHANGASDKSVVVRCGVEHWCRGGGLLVLVRVGVGL